MTERLDKFLASNGVGSRKEVKKIIAQKRVKVDGTVVNDCDFKADFETVSVSFDDSLITMSKTLVGVLYKTKGYVTSTDDPLNPTVMSLIPEDLRQKGLVPVGRLDKDTEGVLLFTNDGQLLHRLISPKSEISKTYYARFEGSCPDDAAQRCKEGIVLKDGSICKSSDFTKLSECEFTLTLTQGMYHQVKRMAAAMGMHVNYLRRESFAGITLKGLKENEFLLLDNSFDEI